MKAVMKTAPGVGNVEVRDIAEPSTPPGHVKIAVQAAGICGTDLHIYYDEYRSWPPVVLGHEVAGCVAEVGSGVERVRPSDRVTTETYFYTCGTCRFCRAGRINLCPERRSIGSAVHGSFTSYLFVPERHVHVMPEDLAVVAGPGAIGLLTAQTIKAAGARVVVLGTDADAHRLRLAAELGADHVFSIQSDDHRAAIGELSTGAGADIVYECSGAGASAQGLLELVRRGGQYAQIGLFGKPVAWDLDQVCYKELAVTGSNASVPSAWERALKLLADGLVKTEPLVSGVFPLTEWRDAFDALEKKSGLKTVLQPAE